MIKFIIISVIAGFLFIILDMVININPLAQKLQKVYQPIARKNMNTFLAAATDLFYGFALTAIYLFLQNIFPIDNFWQNILLYTLLVWFLRVFMMAMTNYIMFNISLKLFIYNLLSGFAEIFIIASVIVLAYRN